jgi:hypothetical protein
MADREQYLARNRTKNKNTILCFERKERMGKDERCMPVKWKKDLKFVSN